MSKEITHAQIFIDNYSIKIVEKNNSIDNRTASDYIFILIQKYKKNEYGYVNSDNDKISKGDADNIKKDFGKWEIFISISQDILKDFGFNNIEIINFKKINQEEMIYYKKDSNDLLQVYEFEKNRKYKQIAEEDITPPDIVRAFTNIKKWRKLLCVKSFFTSG